MRFSLRTLLILFTTVAVSIAGLQFANVAWAAFFYTLAFLAVLTGIVGAAVRRGPTRAFWIGFAIFGGAYFALALIGESSLARLAADRQPIQEPKLATTQLLIWAQLHLRSGSANLMRAPRPALVYSPNGFAYAGTTPSGYFVEVGHSVFTLILAILGGWIGLRFSREAAPTNPDG